MVVGEGKDGDRDRAQPESPPPAPLDIRQLLEAGLASHQAGSFADAERLYGRVLAIDPRNADALHLLGVLAYQTGKPEAAVGLISRAIEVEPDFAEYHSNLGNALAEVARFEGAIAAHQAAIDLQPNYADAHSNLANVLNQIGSFDKALTAVESAIRLGGGYPEAHFNRGIALDGLGRPREAIEAYRTAVRMRPDYAEAHSNLGVALFECGLIDEALGAYDAALRLKPDLADTHRNKAYALLLRGDWMAGWSEYEWRLRAGPKPIAPRAFSRPKWAGGDVRGRTVLLHAEQGLGDTIQFCRYARLVSGLGARVVLDVPRPLVRLLSGLEGVHQLVAEGAVLPAFDVHCPLMSLPGLFRTEPATIPAADAYLAAEPALVRRWSERLGPRLRPRVGLVWSGRAEHRQDRRRSLPLARLLAALPAGFDYVSLQREVRPADQATLARHPEVRHFGRDLTDFAQTAGLVAQMDLVVSVDTSVAHLAGAMGKDVRLLLSRLGQDWRWLLGRADTLWYPTMRLYRQGEDQDWDGPLAALAGDLAPIADRTTP
jgi:tetratricopeptide (TPR) repeat protein